MLDGVKSADLERDFGLLLGHSSRSEMPESRAVAVQKLLANGDKFNARMASHLRNFYYRDALTFLRENDARGLAGLAEPVRDGILMAARNTREQIRSGSMIRPDEFEGDAESVLVMADKVVADKFSLISCGVRASGA